MKTPWPLSRKILLLALLNLVLLAAVMLVFVRSQFGVGQETLLLGPARDRVLAIANAFRLEFDSSPEASREGLLTAYGKRYGADFFLTDGRGESLAGTPTHLPPELLERMNRRPPRPPPPRRAEEDGGRRGEGPPEDRPPDDRRREDRPRGGRRNGDRPPPGMPPEAVFLVITRDPTAYWAGVGLPNAGPEERQGSQPYLLLRATSMFNSKLFFDFRLWLAGALSVVAVSALCWLPFIRGLTRSIGQMDRATAQIAQGRFDIHVVDDRRDELGHLGGQINRMALRLESFVKNQKRFLGDIAHELCAPIARIQFALGILEQKVEDGQRAHVAALHEEIQEMSGLVNELLSFSKAGLRGDAPPLSAVNVASVAQRAATREAFATAPIETAIDPDLAVVANDGYLLRAVSNLLRNAVRYAGAAGSITITAKREGSLVAIAVADRGPGLPEAELEEVFAPFYRPEASRTRETGGAGLGLAIVKTCVEACRGTVDCRNRAPSGLEVTIRLAAADGPATT